MKKLFIPLLVILLVSLIGGVVYASDITTAKFITKIQIDNDAVTAQSNVVGCFDLSTADMITNTMLNATATDAAMLDGATDVKFMPGWSTNPWCTFVSSIAGSTSLYQSLYSGGASGGEYAWFPGAAGGTVPDDASLEFANDGSAVIDGYYDPASSGYLLKKEGAYQVYGNGDGTVTLTLPVSPFVDTTGFSNINDRISNTDGVYATCHNAATGTVGDSLTVGQIPGYSIYRGFVAFDTSSIPASATIQSAILSLDGATDASVTDFDVVVTYNGTLPHDPLAAGDFLYSQYSGNGGSFNTSTWSASSNNITLNATGISWINKGGQTRLAIQSSRDISSTPPATNEYVIFDETLTTLTVVYTINLTTAAVSAGEHTFEVYIGGGNIGISVDGGAAVTAAYAGSIADNANDIYFCTDDIMLYVDSLSMYVSGALVDTWVWQYAATFTGDTTGNILTPSFRTTGSTDIDAAVISCEGTYEATVPTIGVSGGWTMVDSVPVSPSGMFTDGGTGFPLGPQISQMAVDAGDEPESWIGLFALGLAILTFILVYGATHNTRLGRRGSLVLASLAGEGILVYFYIVGAVAGWTLLPAGALLVFLVFWRRSTAPVD